MEPGDEEKQITIIVPMGAVPIRAMVRYEGRFRPLSASAIEAFKAMHDSLENKEVVEKQLSLFQQEMAVSEDGHIWWLPVQETLVPWLKADAKPGEEMVLYAQLLGYYSKEWVFVVNAFQQLYGADVM